MSGGGSGGTGGFRTCFAAGTAITTPSGEVAIERLRVGDVVLGYDEAAHRVVESPVTAVFVHPDQHPGTLATGDGRVLRVTGEHPIYLADDGRYVPAAELEGDERLLALDARGNIQSSIGSMLEQDATGNSETVYNITVAGVHNYFAEGVLVHNKSGTGGTPSCNQVFSIQYCGQADECIDRWSPSTEYIAKNQRVPGVLEDAGAAGIDGGEDAGPPPAPGEKPPSGSAFVSFCTPFGAAESAAPSSYLAFDTFAPPGFAAFELLASENGCFHSSLGQVWLSDYDPPPPNTWTTQCVEIDPWALGDSALLMADTAGALIKNMRFVSGCECPRVRKAHTNCGFTDPLGNGGGSACF
jgi:hypothetical protein